MLENIFKKKRDVSFLNIEGFKAIISHFSEITLKSFGDLIDRYVDIQMKQHVKNKINGENIDENLEIKLRGVMEFKQFFDKLQGK